MQIDLKSVAVCGDMAGHSIDQGCHSGHFESFLNHDKHVIKLYSGITNTRGRGITTIFAYLEFDTKAPMARCARPIALDR